MNHKLSKPLLFSGILLTLLIACSEQGGSLVEEQTLRPVRTLTVVANSGGPMQEFPAVVDAANSADLSFKVAGEVVSLLVKQGQDVSKGDVIAELDNTNYKLALDESQAAFDKAKADFGRAEKLISSGTISQADYDQLKAQFASAKSKLATAKNNLDYTQLHASFNGVVARTHIEKFEEVQAKQIIVTLQDIERINLKVNIPESMMVHVSKEQPKKIVAEFAAIEGKQFPLSFVEVSTQADEVTKAYEVTLSMQPPAGYNILPGMTARVRASSTQGQQNKIYVPIKTVLKDDSGNFVWTVNALDKGKGQITKTSIVVGDITPFGFTVLSGLDEGTHVVTAGMSKVTEGQVVKFSGGA
jgi:RND family efflux transporter MFP subunit